jgi:low temperature requirement protein LtrA
LSDAAGHGAFARPWHVSMTGRDPDEAHRASSPLELLFDLCFVVAVSQAASALHHDLADGQVGHGVVSYLSVFFAIWWPWVNFTWFASAYDTDDVLFRLLAFVQIVGVLIVAAGVPRAFEHFDFSVMLIGYVVMRLSLVALWVRAMLEDPVGRPVAARFAIGISLVQLAWVIWVVIGAPLGSVGFLILAGLELFIPVWAERAGRHTPWHPEHVAERYGLFTIIVLGEVVLAISTAIQSGLAQGALVIEVLLIGAGGLLLVFSLWWLYFKRPLRASHDRPLWANIAWGYGHYVVFASVAALGAGLEVAIDTTHDASELIGARAALTVALPVAIYLISIGILHARPLTLRALGSVIVTAALVLLAALAATTVGVPASVLAMGLLVSVLVAIHVLQLGPPGRPA